ncbi:hypothetical protein B0T14DRAFT_490071 [Immersiella caudata]|uniref:Uncharacterized protein n=1 Tax=Immersiella caudata TaxID=314043 RepID=A0AA40CBR4_9PEZI|nr:hypothetical protein B0T14DRAFT_490071 [Immersiella caudata]
MLAFKLVSLLALGAAALPSASPSVSMDDPGVKSTVDRALLEIFSEDAGQSSTVERRQGGGCVGGNFNECWEFLFQVCENSCPGRGSIIQLHVCVATCITGSDLQADHRVTDFTLFFMYLNHTFHFSLP